MPGRDLVRRARSAGFSMATIIIATKTTIDATVRALNDGADDFIHIPCDTGELLARMRAVVRRSKGHDTSTLRNGLAGARPRQP